MVWFSWLVGSLDSSIDPLIVLGDDPEPDVLIYLMEHTVKLPLYLQ